MPDKCISDSLFPISAREGHPSNPIDSIPIAAAADAYIPASSMFLPSFNAITKAEAQTSPAPVRSTGADLIAGISVSYTHLTLPTILLV